MGTETKENVFKYLVHVGYREIIDKLHTSTLARHGLLCLFSAQLRGFFVRDQYKVIREKRRAKLDSVFLCELVILDLFKCDDERVLDAKHGVGGLVWIVFEIERTKKHRQQTKLRRA